VTSELEPTVVPTREGYDRWSELYDDDGNPLIVLEEPHLARMLGDVKGLRVADVGTGTGRHAVRLARLGARVVALDFSEGMLAKARAKAGAQSVGFVRADCSVCLPLADARFDAVVCALLADHLASLPALFAELARICRPSGSVVLSSIHPALHLRGVRARFTDPSTGQKIYPAAHDHQVSDFVMAAVRAGLRFEEICELPCTDALAAAVPRAAQYLGWPMLLAMRLTRP